MIKVALADDHEIVRDGIKMLLEQDNEISVIWEASDGQDTIEKVSEEKPDVLVADIRMPICNGLEVVQKLKAQDASVKIIMLTMHNDSEYILKSMQYGADGYLLKDTSKTEFHKAIKLVHQNQKYFSGDISTTIVDSLLNNNSTSDFDAGKPSLAKEDYQLTKREDEILKLIFEGVPNKEIAERLGKSIRTIETHRFNIMKKLRVNNITELLKKVEKEGLVS